MVSAPRLSRLSLRQATSQPASQHERATIFLQSFFVSSCNASIGAVTTEKSRENTTVYLIVDNTHNGKNFAVKTLYSASLSFQKIHHF